ncbi:MAG TPA: hypothetical protein VFY45_10970 [Baekduia sp.]|nr:hypothetical protein [Baekduia sp.]
MPSFPTAFKDGDADPSTRPSPCYRYSDAPGGRFSQPTFSPDGAGLAWSAGDGIHVAAVPALAAGCTMDGATAAPPLVIAGGSEPDWGPADVPAPRATGQSGAGSAQGAAKLAITVKRTTLGAALRKGLRISVDVPAAGRLAATAQRRGATVAKAPARSVKAGKRTLTLRFTKAGRRALAHGRSAKVTIGVTFAANGAAQQTTRLSATLKPR